MNLDELKPAWKKQQADLGNNRVDDLAKLVRSKGRWLDKTLLRRDLVESAACVLAICLFGPSFFTATTVIGKIGVALIVFAAIEIMVVLNATRAWRPTEPHVSLGDFTRERISQVDRQIFLLKNVNWWYSGPILVGCSLISLGRDPLGIALVSLVLFLLMGWFLHWLNQRAVRTQLMPLRKELVAALDTFHSLNGDSTDDI